jgi:hypothetical protein
MSNFESFLGLPGTGRSYGSSPKRRPVQMAVQLTLAAAVGLAAGVLTEWSVLHLPYSLEPLSNTAAPWVLVSFAVALTARSMNESLVLAVVCLVALVVGFYVAQATRGWAVSRHQVEFWAASSLLAGPLIGLAAGGLRHAGRSIGALGAGAVGGLLIGEAVHGLTALKLETSAGYWEVQCVLGAGLTVGLTLWGSRGGGLGRVPALAVSVAACAMVGLGTLAAYQIP